MRKHLPTLAQSLAACLHLADRFPSFISSAMTGTRSTEGAKNMNWEFTCIHMHTMNANVLFFFAIFALEIPGTHDPGSQYEIISIVWVLLQSHRYIQYRYIQRNWKPTET